MTNKNILIITGEPSGDIRGREILKHLKTSLPGYIFWGIGGDALASEGMELVEHVRNLSIVGVWEAIKHLPKIHDQYKNITSNIQKRKPAAAILIDYPGFNLKMAKYLKENNIPVIYYVIPQIWAWGFNRINALKQYVDKAFVLFDFEERLLKENGINVSFTGHPLMDKAPAKGVEDRSIDFNNLTVALIPGSRKNEIINMLPAMLGAAKKLTHTYKNMKFIIARSSNADKSLYDKYVNKFTDLNIANITDNTFRVLEQSDFAMVTSGTATLEAAIMNRPMVILYRTSLVTAFLARLVMKIQFIGLVNLIENRCIVPELYQQDVNPEKIYSVLDGIISDPSRTLKIKNELREVTRKLGEKGAAERTSLEISAFITSLN